MTKSASPLLTFKKSSAFHILTFKNHTQMNQTPTPAEPSSCIISPTVHEHEPVLKRNISYEDAPLSVPDLEPDFLHEEVDSPIITTTRDIRSPITQSPSLGANNDVLRPQKNAPRLLLNLLSSPQAITIAFVAAFFSQ